MLNVVDFRNASDTGEPEAPAVMPVLDGEPASALTFGRPVENARARTDVLRQVVREHVVLQDVETQALVCAGSVSFDGAAPALSGQVHLGGPLYVLPFATPGGGLAFPYVQSSKAALTIQGTDPAVNVLTFTSCYAQWQRPTGGAAPDCAAEADEITVEIQHDPAGVSFAVSGAANKQTNILIKINYGVTTCQEVMDALNTPTTPGATAAKKLVSVAYTGTGDPTVATAPRFTTIEWGINYAARFLRGGAPGLVHSITDDVLNGMAGFFATPANVLQKGDTLAIWYDALVNLAATGGRLQSTPENSNTALPATALFNTRREPAKIPNCIPICKCIADDTIVFANGAIIIWNVPATLTWDSVHRTNAETINPAGWTRIAQIPCAHVPPHTGQDTFDNIDDLFEAVLNGSQVFAGTTGNPGLMATGSSGHPGVIGVGGAGDVGVAGQGTGGGSGVHGTGGLTNGIGVHGEGQGTGPGVQGNGDSGGNGVGVNGVGGGTGVGVQGSCVSGQAGVAGQGTLGAAGVYGSSDTGFGVDGVGGPAPNGAGVRGTGTGVSPGVLGQAGSDALNIGVKGVSQATGLAGVYGTGPTTGVLGSPSTGSYAGVQGNGGPASGVGVVGSGGGTTEGGTGGDGVHGTGSGTTGTGGVFSGATASPGGIGLTAAGHGDKPGIQVTSQDAAHAALINNNGNAGGDGVNATGGANGSGVGGAGVSGYGGPDNGTNGAGDGVYGQGGDNAGHAGGVGVRGIGGGTGGAGVAGDGHSGNAAGVTGQGSGTAAGVAGLGGATAGPGVYGQGNGGGPGVQGAGDGAGAGVSGTGGATGPGVSGTAGAATYDGVVGNATTGHGVTGQVTGAGVGVYGERSGDTTGDYGECASGGIGVKGRNFGLIDGFKTRFMVPLGTGVSDDLTHWIPQFSVDTGNPYLKANAAGADIVFQVQVPVGFLLQEIRALINLGTDSSGDGFLNAARYTYNSVMDQITLDGVFSIPAVSFPTSSGIEPFSIILDTSANALSYGWICTDTLTKWLAIRVHSGDASNTLLGLYVDGYTKAITQYSTGNPYKSLTP